MQLKLFIKQRSKEFGITFGKHTIDIKCREWKNGIIKA